MKTFFLLFSAILMALEPRVPAVLMKTTVIVPCHPAHFPLLENLLISYENQTIPPDEIVISLSESLQVDPVLLNILEKRSWRFALNILKHFEKFPPGRNRNEACLAATGDLIICQDADDLPHSQRVEIVRYLFENYQIEHLLHQWLPSDDHFSPLRINQIVASCTQFRVFESISIPNIHNGSVCFLRSVFNQVHWKPLKMISEDALFNRHAYAFCKNKVVLAMPLVQYRGEYSTFDLNGTKGGSLSEN